MSSEQNMGNIIENCLMLLSSVSNNGEKQRLTMIWSDKFNCAYTL